MKQFAGGVVFGVVACFGLVVAFGPLSPAVAQDPAKKGPAPTRWEYRVLKGFAHPEEETLNNLGKDGWEFVTAHASPGVYFQLMRRPLP